MFIKLTFTVLLFFSVYTNAQKNDTSLYIFKQAEAELKDLQKGFLSKIESERKETNKNFIAAWDKIISNPKILNYSFDSIKEVSILTPKDKKFKLITWNLHKDDGTHAFFGYLLVNNNKRIKKGLFRHETIEAYEYFKLVDNSAFIKNPETFTGTPEKWFGMLYYSIVECDGFYTLLGYDPNDKLIRRKFIDVLYFKADGAPVFGKDVFRYARKNPRRIMFEYSSDVSMSLKYNDKRDQIIFSHLAPKSAGDVLQGQAQYYGPDGSFDAMELEKGKWATIEDIDIRSEKNKNDRAKKPNPKEQTPVYKPK